jgi:hypothetical protein
MSKEIVEDVNAKAFQIAQSSTIMASFYDARALLSEISIEKITDPNVESYVTFCKELAEYCIDLGIQRSADISMLQVLTTATWGRTIKTVIWRILKGDIWAPVLIAIEGCGFALRLPGWFRLQKRLMAKYSWHTKANAAR